MNFFKKLIHFLKNFKKYNFEEIDNILQNKEKYLTMLNDMIIKLEEGEIELMEKIIQPTPYNIEFRYSKIAEIDAVALECANFNDYELIKKGVNPTKIMEAKDKAYVSLINNMIMFTNPLYDIYKFEVFNDGIILEIDSLIHVNKLYDLVKDLFSKHFDIEMSLEKSYFKDRVCLKVILKSKDIYKALSSFIVKLNTSLFSTMDELYKTEADPFIHYSKYIKCFNLDYDFINNLDFGKKELIMEIINSHRIILDCFKEKSEYKKPTNIPVDSAKSITIIGKGRD